jgi:uncharacterized protein YrrD
VRCKVQKAKTLVGRPVLSKTDGRRYGTVCDLVFEPDSKTLLGVIFKDQAGEETAFRFSDLQAIGTDAVIAKDGAVPRPAAEFPDVVDARDKDDPLYGLKVISDRGQALGAIEDLLFDVETGKLTGLEISDGLIQDFVEGRVAIPVPESLPHGADALVVPGEVEDRVRAAKGKNKRSD